MLDEHALNGVASPEMLTVTDVAKRLNVHPNSVRRWTKLGLLKCYRVGVRGDRRFEIDEVNSFLNNDGGAGTDAH